jgi:hypothetical protein
MKSFYRRLSLISFLLLWNCGSDKADKVWEIVQDDNYPRWLNSEDYQTEQTSGITFLGTASNDEKSFLLADDIGKIHRLNITADTIFKFTPVQFSEEASGVFADYPKLDFEEIYFDKYTSEVFLSVEGNEEKYLEHTAIFKVQFKKNSVFENEIVNFEKVVFNPVETFNEYIGKNIGFEGFTSDSKFFYLGLEGRLSSNGFADSTFIYIAEKETKKIVKVISTKKLNIHTIGGLFSDEDYSLCGLDRNNRKLFHIRFESDFNIKKIKYWDLKTTIPGYKSYSYTSSLESLTLDGENIYIVDDPWYQFFIPSEEILGKLDVETVKNFNKFVPVIYRYKLIN